MKRLENKNAIVTGAGSGIGRAIAHRLASEGARVGILDVSGNAAEETARDILKVGGLATPYPCDVCDPDAVSQTMAAFVHDSGALGIAVNNAGIAHIGDVRTTTPPEYEGVFRVNAQGVYHCLRAEVEHMMENGGSIINMGSVIADIGVPERFAYAASKAAVHAMTLSVACDFVDAGIRCNAVAPARIHTPFVDGYLAANYPGREAEMFATLSATQPIGRMGTPEDVAALVAFLASDEASFVTGTVVHSDGGFRSLKP